MPQAAQESGFEIRSFMPKYGCINERRNQLHEVIRLSGMNIVVNEVDRPLVIKVASIPQARVQVYFIESEDYFKRKFIFRDEKDKFFADSDERAILFARGALETVKKLRWEPDVIFCQGWITALAPLYLKTAYHNEPFFTNSKIVLMLDDQEYKRPFSTKFSDKLRIDGVNNIDVRNIADFPVGYEELMRLAIDYSDAIVYATPNVNQRLMNYAETKGKPILAYEPQEDPMEACRRQLEFMENIANDEKAE